MRKRIPFTWLLGASLAVILIVILLLVFSDDDSFQLKATINNVSSERTLSKGVFIVHSPDVFFDYEGFLVSDREEFEGLELLVETGNIDVLVESLQGREGIRLVFGTKNKLIPGASETVSLGKFHYKTDREVTISYLSMIQASNDGYVFISTDIEGILDRFDDVLRKKVFFGRNLDAGTEENNPPDTGFIGGQPDPSKGKENIDNGIETDIPVSIHPDFKGESILKVMFNT